MFELLAAGPWTAIGTVLGTLVAVGVHYLFPAMANATFLFTGLVAIGFIAGLALDFRSNRK
jgi:hypothetical protein